MQSVSDILRAKSNTLSVRTKNKINAEVIAPERRTALRFEVNRDPRNTIPATISRIGLSKCVGPLSNDVGRRRQAEPYNSLTEEAFKGDQGFAMLSKPRRFASRCFACELVFFT